MVGKGDGKVYTLILKDEMPSEKRDDGREKARVNWEVEFRVSSKDNDEVEKDTNCIASSSTKIWVSWDQFKPTYRGKEKKDAGQLKTNGVWRVGLMMRR